MNQFELAPVCSSATSSVWMVSTLCGRFCKSFVCRSFLFYLCVFSPYLEFLSGLFFRFPFSQSKFSNCELQKLPKHDACPYKIWCEKLVENIFKEILWPSPFPNISGCRWQSWPFLRALQFCFWDEDWKTNILGWWEFQPVTIPPLAETKLRSCSGRSQQNEPWNLLCISRLVESVIFIYANPQTFSKISFSQSLAETSIEEKYGP